MPQSVAPDPFDVVPESKCDKDQQAGPYDEEIFAANGMTKRLHNQRQKSAYNDAAVQILKQANRGTQDRRDEKAKKSCARDRSDVFARPAQKSGRLKKQKGRNRYDKINRGFEAAKKFCRWNQHLQQFRLHPDARSIQHGEEREPEEKRFKTPPDEQKSCYNQPNGSERRPEKKRQLIAMKNAENLRGRELWINQRHRQAWYIRDAAFYSATKGRVPPDRR